MLYPFVERSFHLMRITVCSHEHPACHSAAQPRTGKLLRRNNRNYICHPAELPLTYRTVRTPISHNEYSGKQFMGLSFESADSFPLGSYLDLTVRVCSEDCSFQGQIEWIDQEEGHYALGICFNNEADAFCARMAEQIGQIEIYRRHRCDEEGYCIDRDQATRDWIEKYSAHFPKLIEEEYGRGDQESFCYPLFSNKS